MHRPPLDAPCALRRLLRALPLLALLFALAPSGCAETENRPPQLQPIEDATFRINQPNTITLFASDPDGDAREFSFTMIPQPPESAGSPTLSKVTDGQAIFQWTPRISALDGGPSRVYQVTFEVNDGRGGQHAETAAITVVDDGVGGSSTLRFVEPSGSGMAVSDNCIQDLPVEVRAQAIANEAVFIEFAPPFVEGATLSPSAEYPGKTRHFNWCPTEAQLNSSLSHTVSFVAREKGSDESITKRFLFRFHRQAGAGCAGQPPVIDHTPPGQFDGPLNYVLTAKITDDVGFKAPPVLAYTVNPAQDPRGQNLVDISGWQIVNFERAGGDLWQATVPNLALAAGKSAEVYYQIIATDDDDPTSSVCDHTTESPVYRFIARAEGGTGQTYGLCAPCVHDAQCGGAEDRCVPLRGEPFCGTTCTGGRDCPSGFQCLQFDSIDGVPTSQCVPADLNCGQLCIEDTFDAAQPNDSPQSTTQIGPGRYEDLSICADDMDFYAVSVEAQQSIRAKIRFENNRGDLDLVMSLPEHPEGEFHYQSVNSDLDEEIVYEPCTSAAGQALIAVYSYYADVENRYQLDIEVGPGQCNLVCENDRFDREQPNDTYDDFTAIELPFYAENLMICREEEDFFGFDAQAGQVLEISLLFEHRLGDLDLALYNSNGYITGSATYRDIEIIEYPVPADDIYIVQVYGGTRSVSNDYALEIRALSYQGCQRTSQCPVGDYCAQGRCVEAACRALSACSGDHLCAAPRAGLDPSVGGECSALCDRDSDCRQTLGYRCKRLEDFSQACVVAGLGGNGDRCESHADCAGERICFPTAGGYCAAGGCDARTPCPSGSICGQINGLPACLKLCQQDSNCRQQEGHRCQDMGGGQRACLP